MVPNIGIIFRSYAKTPELVPEVVKRAIDSIKKAKSIKFFDEPCFSHISIAVPTDYDCGLTLSNIHRQILIADDVTMRWDISVLPCGGHHSCEVLNFAMSQMRLCGPRFCLIASHKASPYLTENTMRKVIFALYSGFRVVGVRIKELNDVQESPIQNTFAVWDMKEMGGLAMEDGTLTPMFFDSELGVEEMAPLIRLQKQYGKCAAVINAEGSLDIRQSEDGKARHKEVRDTKRALQEQEAARLGVTLDFVKENIVEL
jgi:hypothetical protein